MAERANEIKIRNEMINRKATFQKGTSNIFFDIGMC